jgi:hypothetical protein
MLNKYKILVGKPEIYDHSEDLHADKKQLLKWILER